MIITGEDAKLVSKSPNRPDSRPSAGTIGQGSSTDSPPTYQASQRPPAQPQTYVAQQQVAYRESPARRFWRAFIVAILIWFLMSLLVKSIFNVAHWSRHNLQNLWSGDYPVPSNIALSYCVSGDGWSDTPYPDHSNVRDAKPPFNRFPYASSTSFELPLSYETLFLLSRGSQTNGAIDVITSEKVSDVAKVYFTVNYYSKSVRDQGAKVCLIKRTSNEIGVGFFTRQWYRADHGLYYQATVVLPANARHIENLETDVPNTSHRFRDVQRVNFSQIDIKGSNAPIEAQSICADTAIFRTSNSAIIGVFNTSRSLTLRTSNSPIQVDVGVRNEKEYVSELVMRTSNAKIESRVSLTSPTKGGRYLVTATTSNGSLNVTFPTSPLDSTLKLTAATSNAPALVSLDPAYEGTFSLSTSNFSPSLKRRDVQDPTGKGRKRMMEANSYGRGVLRGSVYWSDQTGHGTVGVKSSNSPVTIEL